jgi:hypothetical protein
LEDRVGAGGRSPRLSPDVADEVRARLLLHGKERLALENTLAVAEELGMLSGPVEQILDSTPMLGAAATQDTVRLVRHGVRKLLDAVMAIDEAAAGELDRALEFDYARPADKPDCRWREKAEREKMLTRVAQDAERALQAVEHSDGLLDDERVGEAHRLLRELIGQDFDVDDDGVPRLHQGTRADRIVSVVDPEMRHGRKSSSQRFDGYKLSAAVTNTAEPLITAIDVAPACEHDGARAGQLVDDQPKHRRPPRILGDTAYGVGSVREDMTARKIEVLAPVHEQPRREGRLDKHDFTIDLETETVTCPAGHAAPIGTDRSGRRRALFNQELCGPCTLRERCLGPRSTFKPLRLNPREELLTAARKALDDPATAEHLRRTRPRIERLLGLLAHRYTARKSRYIGSAKARLQATWSAALVNLNPLHRHLAAAAA